MSVETLPNPNLAATPPQGEMTPWLDAPIGEAVAAEPTAGELLERRVDQAVEDCAFKASPELTENLKGFYGEQYALNDMIGNAINNELPTGTEDQLAEKTGLEAVLGRSIFPKELIESTAESLVKYGNQPENYAQLTMPVLARLRLQRLEAPEDPALKRAELMALASANRSLFNEASVAVTTLSEADKQQVIDNQAAIKARVKESGLFYDDNSAIDLHGKRGDYTPRIRFEADPLMDIKIAEEKFWDDSRFAGQLLFHNTYAMDEIWSTTSLMPRRVQVAKTGKYNTKNMETDDYIVDGKQRPRYHSPTPHWAEDFDDYGYRNGDHPGTIAVPFAEMIKTTPYGRDAQYGELELKDEVVEAVIPRVTIHDGTTQIYGGAADQQGAGGRDRTFYQSPYDVAPDAPLEQAPDGYELKLNGDDTWIQLGNEVASAGQHYGTGQGYPKQFIIDVPPNSERPTSPHNIEAMKQWDDARQAIINQAIRKLQHDNITQYGGAKLVVPVRANVTNFYVEDDTGYNGKSMAEFAWVA